MDLKGCHKKFKPSQPDMRQAHGIAEALLIEVEYGGCALASHGADWAKCLCGTF